MIRKKCVGSVLFALLSVSGLFAQSGSSSGEIKGRVTDPSRASIAGSSINVVNLNNGLKRSAMTDDSGVYRVLELQPGTYSIEVAAPGFAGQKRLPVTVNVGKSTEVNFQLDVGPANAVTVDVEDYLVEAERSSQSNFVDEDAIRGLPMDLREYLDIIRLLPGVADSEALADSNDFRVPQAAQSGISFNGNNGRGNSLTVDGAEANDSGGAFRPTISQEAVEEFQINRANYSAEFSGASGGVINIISKSGTNRMYGSAYGFFRTSGLDAADPFARVLVGDTLEGRLLLYDALNMDFQEMKIRWDADCPVCGKDPTITELIDYEQFCGVPARAG